VLITLLVIVLAALAAWGVRLYIDNRNLNSYDYQIQHAEAAYNAGNYADAASFAAQALSLNPQSAEAEYLTAEILMAQENYDRAIPILQDLIAKNQNDADTYGLLIKAYENKDDTASIKKLMDSANEDIRSQYAAFIASEPVFDPAEGDYTDLISIAISADERSRLLYDGRDGSDTAEPEIPGTGRSGRRQDGNTRNGCQCQGHPEQYGHRGLQRYASSA
jgi:tetratricopeptide (TPR) repeat protein